MSLSLIHYILWLTFIVFHIMIIIFVVNLIIIARQLLREFLSVIRTRIYTIPKLSVVQRFNGLI